MIVIGELINGTREGPKQAIADRDADYIADLAMKQEAAGADFIDVNPGTVGDSEVADMSWLVETVQEVVDVPLSFDSPNVQAIKAAFDIYAIDKMPMINSITDEQEKLDSLLPLVVETQANVIALAMSDEGMPSGEEDRRRVACNLIDALTEEGVSPERIFVDPIVTPVSTGQHAPADVLGAIQSIKNHCPDCHVTGGLSNVSFGLPNRGMINRVFMVLCMHAGLDSAILDPLDEQLMAEICATEALLGIDEMCMNYITAAREGKLDV